VPLLPIILISFCFRRGSIVAKLNYDHITYLGLCIGLEGFRSVLRRDVCCTHKSQCLKSVSGKVHHGYSDVWQLSMI